MSEQFKLLGAMDKLRRMPAVDAMWIKLSITEKDEFIRVLTSAQSNDMMEDIFKKQAELDDEILKKKAKFIPKPHEIALAMQCEVSEMIEHLGYKWWKSTATINKAEALKESVDVFHFFVSLLLNLGFSASDLYDGYMDKNNTNHVRANSNY